MKDEQTRIDSQATQLPSVPPRESSLVQVYGKSIGRRIALDKQVMTFGRGEMNEVVLDYDNVSRLHAEIHNRGEYFAVVDKGSTNGTYVNDRLVARERILNSGDLIKIGGSIFKFLSGSDLEGLYFEEIYRMTIIDGLTEIHNKRYLLEFMEREMARCQRYQRPLSLIMFDVDHFKRINDTHGHIAGDYVLKRLASITNEKVRKEELFARYGGEEFTIVMPESDVERAMTFAEKLREIIAGTEFTFQGERMPVTISLGVGQMREAHHEPLDFIHMVDGALYAAKKGGRNRVESVS